MVGKSLDLGIYSNIFPVQVPDTTVEVMTAKASGYRDLRGLREEIRAASCNLRVYRLEDIVLGYGSDLDWLADKRFEKQQIPLYRYPKWCARMIIEGLTDLLRSQGYREWFGKGRIKLYEPQPFRKAAQGHLNVFPGYDLRSIYWRREKQVLFGLIVDICWEIQDASGNRLTTPEVAQFNAMAEIAQIQGEYLPDNRINPEVSRMRLQNHILPFVQQNNRFVLPCSGSIEVIVSNVPLRVILGV